MPGGRFAHRWKPGIGPVGSPDHGRMQGHSETVCKRCGLVRRYFGDTLAPWHFVDLGVRIRSSFHYWAPVQGVWTTINPACPVRLAPRP